MARRNGRRGSGDRVLESRHLVGLFLGVVLLCAVFFSLGYVMGRSQYAGLVHAAYSPQRDISAASLTEPAKPQETTAAPPAAEWDFYSNKNNNHLDPAPKAISPVASTHSAIDNASAHSSPAETRLARVSLQPVRSGPPKMLASATVLQIAAVTRQGDALSVADALQRRKFPAFVVAPSTDHFYRVQVGPYHDERAADAAKAALDHAGFKAIIKR
ncbi:MAG: SPOR domain-containing protein [Candidatus Acidiferrales bacterium]|jgi:cell division septation protein DedD